MQRSQSTTEKRIRRDEPIPRDTVLEFQSVSVYKVVIDDDFLDGAESITLAEVERLIEGNRPRTSLVQAVRRDYEHVDDIDWHWFTAADSGTRFESAYEEDRRLRGENWDVPEYVGLKDVLAAGR